MNPFYLSGFYSPNACIIFLLILKRDTGNILFKKALNGDFPGGPVVKNPPCNAGDAGSIPGQGTKIPHATGN